MSEDQDDSQKTEEPTHKRLEDAEKKGQFPISREVNNLFILMAFAMTAISIAPSIMSQATIKLRRFIEAPDEYLVGDNSFFMMMKDIMLMLLVLLIVPLILSWAAAFGGRLIQHRFMITLDPITPKFERISPLKGLEKMFSMKSVIELLKGIIKITVVGTVGFIAVHAYLPRIMELAAFPLMESVTLMQSVIKRMLIGMCCAVFVLAIADVLYQRFDFMKSMRMSRQELKDEYRQQEGDPMVKQRLRQIRRDRARKRMMASVPTADVIVTNPTHYAAALKYNPDKMAAPMLVAKGLDKIAERIREVAKENDVPIVENPPLARALYATVDVDREIPLEHYKAVAEIISYVYKLKGKVMKG